MSIETITRRRIFAFLAAVSTMLACGSLLMRHAGAEEVNDEAALKKRFEFLSQNGKRGVLGQIRGVDCHHGPRCEASGLLLRADGRGPLPSAD